MQHKLNILLLLAAQPAVAVAMVAVAVVLVDTVPLRVYLLPLEQLIQLLLALVVPVQLHQIGWVEVVLILSFIR
jgi:hypothetical protein